MKKAAGKVTDQELAQQYGVCRETIVSLPGILRQPASTSRAGSEFCIVRLAVGCDSLPLAATPIPAAVSERESGQPGAISSRLCDDAPDRHMRLDSAVPRLPSPMGRLRRDWTGRRTLHMHEQSGWARDTEPSGRPRGTSRPGVVGGCFPTQNTARAFTGDPGPLTTRSGATTSMNSQRFISAAVSATASRSCVSSRLTPIAVRNNV